MRIILASASPQRRKLLRDAGVRFEVKASHYREDLTLKMAPKKLAMLLARGKARAVAKRYPAALIIGADTVAVCAGKVIGKPKSKKDAARILRLLSNKRHTIITAVALLARGAEVVFADAADVTFKKLSSSDIEEYVATGEPMGAAGAYRIQKGGKRFVRTIKGRRDTIVGLPVALVKKKLNMIERIATAKGKR